MFFVLLLLADAPSSSPDAPRALSASAPAVAAPGLETPPSEIPVPDALAPPQKHHDFSIGGGALILFPANNTNFFSESAAVDPANGEKGTSTRLADGSRWPHGLPYTTANPIVSVSYAQQLSVDQRWWIVGGIGLALLGVINDPDVAFAGTQTLYVDILLGARAYFIPGSLRPFAELGLRFGLVSDTSRFINDKLKVFPGVYATLGGEWSITSSVGVFVAARYTLLFQYPFVQESAFEPLAGVRFYF